MSEPCEPYHVSHLTPCIDCKRKDDRFHALETEIVRMKAELDRRLRPGTMWALSKEIDDLKSEVKRLTKWILKQPNWKELGHELLNESE